MFADAPLVVRNQAGQRLCETQVGQRYGSWKVSANTTNTRSPRLAGVRFLRLAGLSGWRYSDGSGGPPGAGRFVSETYPYATLIGARNWAMTPNGPATNASHRAFRPPSGGPSAPPPATR